MPPVEGFEEAYRELIEERRKDEERARRGISLDTGVLPELIYPTPAGSLLKEALIEERFLGHTSEFNLIELKYVLCRKLGRNEAVRRTNALESSGYVIIHETSRLADKVALLKCKHALAVGDCFTLAVAKRIGGLLPSQEERRN